MPRLQPRASSLQPYVSSQAQLDEAAQQRLVDSLRLLPAGLTSLQLDGCAIGPRGAAALGALLCEGAWPLRLGRLTLAHNPIGKDEGTVALAAALRCSHSLVELDLTHTQVELQPHAPRAAASHTHNMTT